MWPDRWARRCGRTAWQTHIAPKRLTSSWARASASVNSSIMPEDMVPALLTTMSSWPKCSAAVSTAANTAARSVTSRGRTSRRSAYRLGKSSRVTVRAAAATRSPRSSAARANARPRPRPAPVMNHVRQAVAGMGICENSDLSFRASGPRAGCPGPRLRGWRRPSAAGWWSGCRVPVAEAGRPGVEVGETPHWRAVSTCLISGNAPSSSCLRCPVRPVTSESVRSRSPPMPASMPGLACSSSMTSMTSSRAACSASSASSSVSRSGRWARRRRNGGHSARSSAAKCRRSDCLNSRQRRTRRGSRPGRKVERVSPIVSRRNTSCMPCSVVRSSSLIAAVRPSRCRWAP